MDPEGVGFELPKVPRCVLLRREDARSEPKRPESTLVSSVVPCYEGCVSEVRDLLSEPRVVLE